MKMLADLSQEELNILIEAYIEGEDIKVFELDYLENDYSFMTRVIMKTNDKNFYDLSSDNLKGSFNFIKFLVEKFGEDKFYVEQIILNFFKYCKEEDKLNYEIINYFSQKIGDLKKLMPHMDYFIENCENEYQVLGFLAKFSNNKDDFIDYALKFNVKIIAIIVEVYAAVMGLKDRKLREQAGLGFFAIKNQYAEFEAVLNAFASKYLFDIFYDNGFNIEKFLHESFSSKEAVLKYGLNAFIGDYIKKIDDALAEYVLARPELMKEVLKDFKAALDNWDNFRMKNNDNRIEIVYEEAKNYLSKNDFDIGYSYLEVVYYIAEERGLTRLFMDYDLKKYYKDEEDLYEVIDLSLIKSDEGNFSLAERKYINYMREVFDKVFNQRVVEEMFDNYIIEEPKAGRIFDFNSIKKN